MKTKVQKKLDNVTFDALREIKFLKNESIREYVSTLAYALVCWDLEDYKEHPDFQTLGYFISRLGLSDYQCYCFKKLYSILYDGRILYENNLITYNELLEIVIRVKKDCWKRFKSIEKSHAKKELKNQKLDSDSLLILKAKLALLENEN